MRANSAMLPVVDGTPPRSVEILNCDVDAHFAVGRFDRRDQGFETLIVAYKVRACDHCGRAHR